VTQWQLVIQQLAITWSCLQCFVNCQLHMVQQRAGLSKAFSALPVLVTSSRNCSCFSTCTSLACRLLELACVSCLGQASC
jgi:hypothetical protein